MPDNSLIEIAAITAAHGIRGEVKLRSFANPPEKIFSYTLSDISGARIFKLVKKGVKDDLFIASIADITDRNQAELLKGTKLYTSAKSLPPKKANEWTHAELTGLEVRLSDGKKYGTVSSVHNFGAGDILDITLVTGASEMLPFSGKFIGDIMPEKGYLIVLLPEYTSENDTQNPSNSRKKTPK